MWTRIFIFLSIFLGGMSGAHAWHIEDYQIEVELATDSTFVVKEDINVDFENQSKHGIFRDIPTTYVDEKGVPYDMRFQVLRVLDEDSQPWPYKIESDTNFMRIKIGSPSKTITGAHMYRIIYKVSGAMLFLDDHDELYWNAVGPQWEVPINHVSVRVILPQPIPKESLRILSFTGKRGSRSTTATGEIVTEQLVTFEGSHYAPYEAFTVAVALPKGIITKPVYVPKSSNLVTETRKKLGQWIMIFPLIVFILMFLLWKRYGKDPVLSKSVVVEYKAPYALKPAEVGTVIDGRVDQRDITSTIIDLAIRGYIKIVQKKKISWMKEYSFVMMKPFTSEKTLKDYELTILSALFGSESKGATVSLEDLKNDFYTNLEDISQQIKGGLEKRNYLANDPQLIVSLFCIIAFIFILIALGAFFSVTADTWLGIAFFTSGVIIFIFGLIMPKRTLDQADAVSKVLGFKEFLLRTEKEKIDRSTMQDTFESMLPYTMALGISNQWANKFSGLYTQTPAWFEGDYGHSFVYHSFVHDLDRSLDHMATTFYSYPQTVSSSGAFSGGGFSGGSSGGSSGGGGGGGGGGSW